MNDDSSFTYAVMFDNFGPYHTARLNSLRAYGHVVGLEASPVRSEYKWAKPVIPAGVRYAPFELDSTCVTSPRQIEEELDRHLSRLPLTALAVPGWSSLAALVATRWAARKGVSVIGMSDTNVHDQKRSWSVEAIKRAVVAHYAGGITGSTTQADYLASLGVPRDAIKVGYDVVDNAYFADSAESTRADCKMPDINGEPLPIGFRGQYFLTVCRLVSKKNVPGLVRAYRRFRDGRQDLRTDWPLIILGDGEELCRIQAEVARCNLEGHIILGGFRQQKDLPLFYATAGAFILASTTEQWGLVVNEAMASGLPVAVSSRCGCVEELVEDGVTGIVFNPFDETAIAEALKTIATGADRADLLRRASQRIAAWDVGRFGAALAQAAQAAANRPRVRASIASRVGLEIAIAMRRRELVAKMARTDV